MNIKLIVTMLAMSFGISTHAAQLPSQETPAKKEVSIIKSFAASIKEEQTTTTSSKQTALDQLIKSNSQQKTIPSAEENRASASITPKQNLFITRGKKINHFIQNLFGG